MYLRAEDYGKNTINLMTNFLLSFLIFVLFELCSEKDCVITHVCMYVVCGNLVSFVKSITVSTYIDVFPWDLDTMILG